MSSPNKFYLLCASTIFLFAFSTVSRAMVYDGGQFTQDKVTTHTDLGSSGPEPVPTNLAYDLDRYSNAPVGVPLYVLGTDDKCYRGNFSYSKYEKVLIVYSKSQVPSQYCIYQRNFSSAPAGFAISTRDGGVCVPAIAGEDGKGMGIEERGTAVAFSDCIADTVSYGDYIDKNKDKGIPRSVAAQDDKPLPTINKDSLPNWVTSAQEVAQSPNRKTEGEDVQLIKLEMPTGELAKKVTKAKPIIKGGYTFQISAHNSAEEAGVRMKELKEKGVAVFMMNASVNGTLWYRVCSGRYETMKAAKAAQKSFADKTGLQGTFIQKIVSQEDAAR